MSGPAPYQRPSYEVARHSARAEPTTRIEAARPPGWLGDEEPVAPDIRKRALVLRFALVATVAVAVAATALLGGFDRVVAPVPERVPAAVGEEINAGPFLVTIESAQIGHGLRGRNLGDDGDPSLQVNVKITVLDNRTRYIGEAIELEGVDGLIDPSATPHSLRDNSLVFQAQPGLPVRVAFLWPIEAGTPVPDEITVLIPIIYRRYQSFRFIGETIEHSDASAQVRVPVLDRTATA